VTREEIVAAVRAVRAVDAAQKLLEDAKDALALAKGRLEKAQKACSHLETIQPNYWKRCLICEAIWPGT
jgi:hypothetical protein